METLLDFIGLGLWIIAVLGLAASMTWVIVKLFPGDKPEEANADQTNSGS